MSLMDLAYRMGRLEADIRDLSDLRCNANYASDRVRELTDTMIQIFKDLKMIYVSFDNVKKEVQNIYSRISQIEEHVFNSK